MIESDNTNDIEMTSQATYSVTDQTPTEMMLLLQEEIMSGITFKGQLIAENYTSGLLRHTGNVLAYEGRLKPLKVQCDYQESDHLELFGLYQW